MVITETGYSKLSPYVIPGLKFSSMPTLDQEYKAKAIINKVAETLNIPVDSIVNRGRKRDVVAARFWCMWFVRCNTTLSLKQTGALFSDKDHTSVIHGLQTIMGQLKGKHPNLFKDQYEILKLII